MIVKVPSGQNFMILHVGKKPPESFLDSSERKEGGQSTHTEWRCYGLNSEWELLRSIQSFWLNIFLDLTEENLKPMPSKTEKGESCL